MTDADSALAFDQARFNMIEQQVRPWDVLDQRVLDVMAEIPREDFVPERYRPLAFSDLSLPLEHGQVMLPPRIQGRLLQALDLRPDDRILEVGTGTGYLTACLARLGGQVLSVDIHGDFLETAQACLGHLGIDNLELREADAAGGWPEDGAFDAIAVTGSLPRLHEGFHRALREGGRLFLVTGRPPVMEAMLLTRVSGDQWAREDLFETSIPPLENAPADTSFGL